MMLLKRYRLNRQLQALRREHEERLLRFSAPFPLLRRRPPTTLQRITKLLRNIF
jgi:hypothetical protein